MVELIDLSGRVEAGQPVYPGSTETVFWITNTHEQSALSWSDAVEEETGMIKARKKALEADSPEKHTQRRAMVVGEHGPTHIDALSHVDPKHVDRTIDTFPLERFYGDCIAVDLSHISPEEFIEVADLKDSLAEHDFSIQRDDAILLHTGNRHRNYSLDDARKKFRYLHKYTGLSKEAAYWLGEHGVSNIGIDSPSIDHSSSLKTKDYPAHEMCSEYEVLNMENMANIDAVAGNRFTLCAFPLKLDGGSGSPIRPVAIFDD